MMKRNHLLFMFIVMLTTIMSCKKKDKVDIDINNSKQPEITGFTPGHGIPGTEVTVSGKNFSTNIPDNKLFLGPDQMVVTQATATTLKFKVPYLAVSGKIKVENGNKSVTSANTFTVDPLPDGIAEFSPMEGPFGTEVTIKGVNFPLSPKVSINGLEGMVISSSTSQIRFEVPYHTGLTKHKIVVEGGGKTFTSAQDFTVTTTGKYADWHLLPEPPNTAPANIFANGTSFTYNKKLFWGFTALGGNDKRIFYNVYDPAAADKGWQLHELTGKLPESISFLSAAVLGNKVYMGNGSPESNHGKWWSFDPSNDAIQPIAAYPKDNAVMGFAFSVSNKFYAAGGLGEKHIYNYDPAANTWTKAVDAPYAQIVAGAAVVLNNDVIIGRALKTLTGSKQESVYKFTANGAGGTLTELPLIPDAGQSSGFKTPSFPLNGKAYFVINKRVWEYDPAVASPWRMVLQENITSTIQHVGVIDGKVYGWTGRGRFFEFRFRN